MLIVVAKVAAKDLFWGKPVDIFFTEITIMDNLYDGTINRERKTTARKTEKHPISI